MQFPITERTEIPITGYHGMPIHFYKLAINNSVNRDITANIDEYGFPFLIVDIINPVNQKSFENAKAIIDTGAAGCLIQQEIANCLGLSVEKTSEYKNPKLGLIASNHYTINLLIDAYHKDGSALLKQIPVGTLNEPTYPSSMIIGMDFLKFCRFQYDGKISSFRIQIEI